MSQPVSPFPHPVARFLSSVHPGIAQHAKALSLWPLLPNEPVDDPAGELSPKYITLGEAVAAGCIRIDEVSASGSVPHVTAENRGDAAVLVLFGEELRGAKQNRVANATFLVPPHSRVNLDVSCVEQGRWDSRPASRFRSTDEVMSSAVRRKMAAKVSESRSMGHSFDADQGEVWEEVQARMTSSGTRSRTGAWADHVEARQHDVAELSACFGAVPGQKGFVAAIGGEIVGLEAVGRPEVFLKTFPGLLRAYVIDAVDGAAARPTRKPAGTQFFEAPEPFLSALSQAPAESSPSLGMGEDLRLTSRLVHGCALVAGEVIHLTGFPA
jgi:hypothetical protein